MQRFRIPSQVLGGTGPIPGAALKPTLFVREITESAVSEDGMSLIDVTRVILEFWWKLDPGMTCRFLFTDFETDAHSEKEVKNESDVKPWWLGAQIVNPFDPPRPHWPMVIPK